MVFGTILYFFNPESTIWFPKCPFYILTGYQCPACGIQRAAYHTLHCQFGEAFKYNLFLAISIPYALLLIIVSWIAPQKTAYKLRHFCTHPATVKVFVMLTIMWWIVRNM